MTGEPIQQAGNLIRHTYGYVNAHVNAEGALVHSGQQSGEGYHYVASDGTTYQRNWTYDEDGNPTGIIGHGVTGPALNGKQTVTLTVLNHANRSYSVQRTEYPVTDETNAPPILGLESTPSAVQQALQNGTVTRKGTVAVNGTPTIAIAVPHSAHLILYVDARTHQPLRTVTVGDDNTSPFIADRIPATPANIAKTRADPIPADYTKVDFAG